MQDWANRPLDSVCVAVSRWKPVINAFAITFGDRRPGAETY